MSDFRRYVSEGIDALPLRILDRLSNVAVVIEDRPTSEQKKGLGLGKDHSLLGLYEGIPQTERGSLYEGFPDKITIFKKAIESQANSESEIRELVKNTVWHEVAHHFGMEEDEVRTREEENESES